MHKTLTFQSVLGYVGQDGTTYFGGFVPIISGQTMQIITFRSVLVLC